MLRVLKKNTDGFGFRFDGGAFTSDTKTDIITHKDCNPYPLSFSSIIARNSIIRNIELKLL